MGVEASPADIPKFGWDDHSSNVNVVEDAYVQEGADLAEEQKFTLSQAFCLNALNMFGTGPFVTLPLVLAAGSVAGPQVSHSECQLLSMTLLSV